MNVVDSSGWIEYFTARVNAAFFIPPIQATDQLLLPTICLYEVFKRLLAGLGEDSALQAIGLMARALEVDLTRQVALEAARISLERKLAMADSIILATAYTHNATLWTQDEHFKGMPGVKYIPKQEP